MLFSPHAVCRPSPAVRLPRRLGLPAVSTPAASARPPALVAPGARGPRGHARTGRRTPRTGSPAPPRRPPADLQNAHAEPATGGRGAVPPPPHRCVACTAAQGALLHSASHRPRPRRAGRRGAVPLRRAAGASALARARRERARANQGE